MNALKELSFDEFDPISKAIWLQKLQKELKESGKEFAKTDIEPFYTSEDISTQENFARNQLLTSATTPWLIDEEILYSPDITAKIKNAIKSGADGISLSLAQSLSYKEVENLQEIGPSLKFLNFCLEEDIEIPNELFEGGCNGALRITIKKNWLSDNTLERLYGLLQRNFINYRLLSISSSLNNKDSDIVTELSSTLALAIEYIHYFTEKGIPLIPALRNIEFTFTTGKDFLMEISKLRAFRLLWNRVMEAYKINPLEINTPLHCVAFPEPTPSPENVIELTTKAMSSVLGGCNSLTIKPFDNKQTDFSERISRNIALLLKEESYLDKVSDPLGGAYYIEKTTSVLTEKAWALLRDIENKGGYLKNL